MFIFIMWYYVCLLNFRGDETRSQVPDQCEYGRLISAPHFHLSEGSRGSIWVGEDFFY